MTRTLVDQNKVYAVVIGLVLFAVVSRLAPHPANVAPLAAVALFGGALLPRKLALTVPLAAMVVSDLIIGMHSLVFVTWACFALIAIASSYRFGNITTKKVLAWSIGSSVFFYLVTNFGVWAEGRMYTMTFEGLLQCYYNALPFFRNTLVGDMAYSGVLFGMYALVTYSQPVLVPQKER